MSVLERLSATRFIEASIVFLAILIAASIVNQSDGQTKPAASFPLRLPDSIPDPLTVEAFPFTLHNVGNGYAMIDQGKYRRAYFHKKSISGFAHYGTESSLSSRGNPYIVIKTAGPAFRLDCPDEEHAIRFTKFMLMDATKVDFDKTREVSGIDKE